MEEASRRSTTPADRVDAEVATLWGKIRARLEDRRRRISQEIREYPTPIAGCDAQFNYLLEERDSVAQELQCAREAVEGDRRDTRTPDLLADLARASRHLDEELRREIVGTLAARLSDRR